MMSDRHVKWLCPWVVRVLGLLALIPSAADAALIIAMLAEPGPGVADPMTVDPRRPGESFTLDVYAFVLGRDPSPEKPEALQSVIGSFRAFGSTGGTEGRFTPAGDLDQATHTVRMPAVTPFNGPAAAAGDVLASGTIGRDVDRDDPAGLVAFSASSMQFTGDPEPFGWLYPFRSNIRQFLIGKVEFTVTEMSYPGAAFGYLGFVPWRDGAGNIPAAAASWIEDGQIMDGATGAIEVWGIQRLMIGPEPSAMVAMGLMGSILLVHRQRQVAWIAS